MTAFNLEQALHAHDIKAIVDAADAGDHIAQDFCFLHPILFDLLKDDVREAVILGALRTGHIQIEYAANDLKLTVPNVKKKLLHRLTSKKRPEASLETMEARMQADIRHQHKKSSEAQLKQFQVKKKEEWVVPEYILYHQEKAEIPDVHRDELVVEAVEETRDLTTDTHETSEPQTPSDPDKQQIHPHHEATPTLVEE